MILKFFEFNTSAENTLDKDYETLLDVFSEVSDMDDVYLDIKYSTHPEVSKSLVMVNIDSQDENKIKSIRRSDVFFRVERLTNYRIEDLDQVRCVCSSVESSDREKDLFIQVYYHWDKEENGEMPISPRNSTMIRFESGRKN